MVGALVVVVVEVGLEVAVGRASGQDGLGRA
jgi:hypothetical protein